MLTSKNNSKNTKMNDERDTSPEFSAQNNIGGNYQTALRKTKCSRQQKSGF